jgi:hypothetical protein
LEDTAEELIEKLRQKRDADECNKEFMTISHIKKVTVVLTEKHTGKNSLNEGIGCCGSHGYDFHFSDVFLSYYVFEWFGLMFLSGISHATTEYVLVSADKISLVSVFQTDIIYTI